SLIGSIYLRLAPPLSLSNRGRSSGSFSSPRLELRLRAELGAEYQIEFSEDLKSWTPFNVVTNADGAVAIDDPLPEARQRFYRAVKR
ncbi:MAG: hypothetical protein HYY23_08685, partial [Verrucomicrobia bacterium]|nr:hypothetical protein [Verrucomicrobiota bacterium]